MNLNLPIVPPPPFFVKIRTFFFFFHWIKIPFSINIPDQDKETGGTNVSRYKLPHVNATRTRIFATM